MMNRLAALVAGLSILSLAACVGETQTDVSVRTYNVSGTTLNSLERSLATHGPQVPGVSGRAFAAVETSFLHSFEAEQTGDTCRFGRNGRVALRSEVILPKWRQRDGAPESVRIVWDLYSSYAVIHEKGHIKISQKYAKILEQIYRRVAAPDCKALEAEVVKEVERILAQHSAEQQLYDATDLPRFERYLRRNGFTLGA